MYFDKETLFTIAEKLWQEQYTWQKRILDYAAKSLLELKNDAWIDSEDECVTAEEFIARMTLREISIEKPDKIIFWFDDGDLFHGHTIHVVINPQTAPLSAGIHSP